MRGDDKPCDPEVSKGFGDPSDPHAVREHPALCFADGRPFFGAHRVQEHNASDLTGMLDCKTADDQGSERVPNEQIRRRDPSALQEVAKIANDV